MFLTSQSIVSNKEDLKEADMQVDSFPSNVGEVAANLRSLEVAIHHMHDIFKNVENDI